MDSSIVFRYFPNVDDVARDRIIQLKNIYLEWNALVNLISRNDIAYLYERHVLHSLSISKFIKFLPGTKVMDIGTGGGFPGIPLAILFPEVQFTLVDSIGKKIKVVQDVISRLDLKNTTTICDRAENLTGSYDYVVSRATAPLSDIYKWSRTKISPKQINAVPNGIICLKGGDLTEEIKPFKGRTEVVTLSDYFTEDYFITKKLLFLTV